MLIDALERRGLTLSFAENLPQVMVALATADVKLVLVVEPGEFARLGELLQAIHVYHPQTTCWRYEAEENGPGRLAKLNAPADARPAEDRPTDTKDAAAGHEEPRARNNFYAATGGNGSMITEEELTMLLASDQELTEGTSDRG